MQYGDVRLFRYRYNSCTMDTTTLKPRYSTYTEMAHILAVHSQKDMDWNLALKGPDADKAITALENEMTSLTS